MRAPLTLVRSQDQRSFPKPRVVQRWALDDMGVRVRVWLVLFRSSDSSRPERHVVASQAAGMRVALRIAQRQARET